LKANENIVDFQVKIWTETHDKTMTNP